MTRLAETVRVGTSQACVLHGHPKKAGSKTDKPKGSEIKCYPFSGEGGRAGAIKKAYSMHTAIQKSQERGESAVYGMRRLQEVLSGSEALYGFCGWLTARPERTVMSASDDAGGIADLVAEFSEMQGLPAPREGWDKELVSMNPVRRKNDAKMALLPGEPRRMNRLATAVAEADAKGSLERGIHFKSKDWAAANEFSLSRRFPMVVMKGDDGEFWVVRVPDGERLAKAGYEYAR